MHTGFGCGNLMERGHLEDLGVDGRIIMELFSNRLGRDWTDLVQDMGKTAGSCGYVNEPSSYIKCSDFN